MDCWTRIFLGAKLPFKLPCNWKKFHPLFGRKKTFLFAVGLSTAIIQKSKYFSFNWALIFNNEWINKENKINFYHQLEDYDELFFSRLLLKSTKPNESDELVLHQYSEGLGLYLITFKILGKFLWVNVISRQVCDRLINRNTIIQDFYRRTGNR